MDNEEKALKRMRLFPTDYDKIQKLRKKKHLSSGAQIVHELLMSHSATFATPKGKHYEKRKGA